MFESLQDVNDGKSALVNFNMHLWRNIFFLNFHKQQLITVIFSEKFRMRFSFSFRRYLPSACSLFPFFNPAPRKFQFTYSRKSSSDDTACLFPNKFLKYAP